MKKLSLGLVAVLVIMLVLSGIATAQSSPVPVQGVSIMGCPTVPIVVGKYETLTVTVKPASATNKNVAWSSSNPQIALVSAVSATEARVTAVAPGYATITVTTEDGKHTAKCEVTVVGSDRLSTPRTSGSLVVAYLLGAALLTGGGMVASKRFRR